ncbi:hypothetical protein H4Q26_007238 [Puccinia striiformis f. sp. tritici PST-130]|nr:hypothetical protein H4Q26_007238 [Puccinia striiformis f. sp. tritici PST-130]
MRVTQSLILTIFAVVSSLAVAMPADEPAAKVGQPISRDSTSRMPIGGATRKPDTKVDQSISRDSTSKVLTGGATRELDTKVDQPISRDSSPKALTGRATREPDTKPFAAFVTRAELSDVSSELE